MVDVTLPAKRVTGETLAERLTENVRERVLPARYLRRDETGDVVETPEELFERVASAVAAPEAEYGNDPEEWGDRFESMLTGLAFVPNSPTLMNAGTSLGQLAACFVVSPDDDLSDIFRTVRRAAEIFQTGGGVGYSFSRLRPKGDVVTETGGVASGPVSFMSVYDQMCETVKAGGKRRGAQMGVLRVDHPDVGRFAVAKRGPKQLTNFNVSVGLTDDFLHALDADEEYQLINPRSGKPYEATEHTAQFYNAAYADADEEQVEENLWRDFAADVPGLQEYRGDLVEVGEPMSLPADLVWTLVVDGAWRLGDPGLFMLDRANDDHSFDTDAHPEHWIEATNPCGEQPLEDYEACNLGHVNLSLMVAEDAPTWGEFDGEMDDFLETALDTERLERVTRDGTRFLDDVISASTYPLDEIAATVESRRKIGVGVMGFAELLVQLGIRYGSADSIECGRQVMRMVDRFATDESHRLARERGAFPDWDASKYATPRRHEEWFERHTGEDAADWGDGYPIRNHGVTSIAPTGTTSMIANTSAGCEPFYDVVYFKNVGRDVQGTRALVEFDDYFLRVLEANDVDPDVVREQAAEQLQAGEFAGIETLPVPDELAELFVTAREVAPEKHVRMQGAFQERVDGAVSKTVNLPGGATRADVADAFREAVDTDCKGITVYRAGSREEQVLTTSPEETG